MPECWLWVVMGIHVWFFCSAKRLPPWLLVIGCGGDLHLHIFSSKRSHSKILVISAEKHPYFMFLKYKRLPHLNADFSVVWTYAWMSLIPRDHHTWMFITSWIHAWTFWWLPHLNVFSAKISAHLKYWLLVWTHVCVKRSTYLNTTGDGGNPCFWCKKVSTPEF